MLIRSGHQAGLSPALPNRQAMCKQEEPRSNSDYSFVGWSKGNRKPQPLREVDWSEDGRAADAGTAHPLWHLLVEVQALLSLHCRSPRRDHAHTGGHSLLRTANSSSEGFRSGLRFGSSFFMVLGLLLRS